MPIEDALCIESKLMIYHLDELWPEQSFYRKKTAAELSARIALAVKSNRRYLFEPLTIGDCYYLTLRGVRVGNRLNHGNAGKKGLSFPVNATKHYKTQAEAEKAKLELITYFRDLAAKTNKKGERDPSLQFLFDP